MQYNYREIENKWQKIWQDTEAYKVNNESEKPKCYILDMFPYPSGAGLHVGHPLGYIASDIYARYKRLKGFNVLHPMGFDAFGLPAEQYAIETGQHPAVTTEKNIARYKEQLNNIGFCFDWSREVKTSDPTYYKWTQWIFLQLYNSWYNPDTNKAEPISTLTEARGQMPENELMQYRLAYRAESYVNWCEALGTVLANDEVVNGVSERGGHPVERRQMSQWFLRITAFAERLLEGLEKVDFPESLKEMQKNWIGKSTGAEIKFQLSSSASQDSSGILVFTTRPDTIFGVSFMVLAPEHELVNIITTPEQKQAIEEYKKYVSSRSERDRLAETKKVTGVFTGAYAIHPFTKKEIPVWISEYVLAGYGTGAIMAVPCGDDRDHAFAKHFGLAIPNIFKDTDISEKAYSEKSSIITHSDFLDSLSVKDAASAAIDKIEELKIGTRKVNYRMRDAGFSRQRYWGEPFPIVYNENNIPQALAEYELPVELPHLETYSAGPNGKGPLANAKDWAAVPLLGGAIGFRETDTMPGYAGSSWYYLRYMDPHNDKTFCDKKISNYWNQVDVYVGGAEHAVGHLLYSRMWCKALYDLGHIGFDEPYKKLINQGMIQGNSSFIHFVGINFGTHINIECTKKQLKDIATLREKYKVINDLYISSDLMPYLRKSFYNPATTEEKKHEEKRKKLYNHLIQPIYDDIKKMGLENVVMIFPMMNYYKVYAPIEYVNYKNELDVTRFINDKKLYSSAIFLTNEENKFICSSEVEKMSKSKYNVINPDDIIEQYGTDTFRMYEMFLGPLEVSKPWDTKGIEGVHRFLKKLWRLYADENNGLNISEEKATNEELKVLHQTIKKVAYDIEHFAFNTSVSQFMICVNELGKLQCNKREILQPLLITLTPFAPHISAELWSMMGNTSSILDAEFPAVEEKYLIENTFRYPIAVQGKARTEMEFALDASLQEIESKVLADEIVMKWMEDKPLKKFIFVKGKMINVVV